MNLSSLLFTVCVLLCAAVETLSAANDRIISKYWASFFLHPGPHGAEENWAEPEVPLPIKHTFNTVKAEMERLIKSGTLSTMEISARRQMFDIVYAQALKVRNFQFQPSQTLTSLHSPARPCNYRVKQSQVS